MLLPQSPRQWCTWEEVLCGCSYEPKDAWFSGLFAYNSGKSIVAWPFCQPGLGAFYASPSCDPVKKALDSCDVPKCAASSAHANRLALR